MKRQIRVGSRESALAVAQSRLVMEEIERAVPGAKLTLVTMKTTGDRILDRPLERIGGKGLFVKELDLALREGRCDLAVHSLKDMPMEEAEELPILAYSKREDRRDVLVLREGLKELPPCPVLGTSSRRRRLQAGRLFPDARFEMCRGNLATRLDKLDRGDFDALILAAAGLKRMGYGERISRYFTVEEMIPAAGQGILAVQGRAGENADVLEAVDCPESRVMAEAERAFVRAVGGGCSFPAAAAAVLSAGGLSEDALITLSGLYYEEESGRWKTGSLKGRPEEAGELGRRLAALLSRGEGSWN